MSRETEKKFTRMLNRDRKTSYWDKLEKNPSIHQRSNIFAIHIVREKRSKILGKKVYPKADLALARGEVDEDYLEENNYYLNEEDKQVLGLEFVSGTGISVKKPGSDKYTITKMNPSTFSKVFGSRELGAGASVYCRRSSDIKKNEKVIKGWGTSLDELVDYFSSVDNVEKLETSDKPEEKRNVYRDIKSFANNRIEEMIMNDEDIYSFIFRGEGNFREPFTAPWLYQDEELKRNEFSDFKVTTGSGRSRGDFTIVIKP